MKVRFTPSARTQFLAALAYIYRENPTAVVAFRHKPEKSLSRLQKFPQSGRTLPEFPALPFMKIGSSAHLTATARRMPRPVGGVINFR